MVNKHTHKLKDISIFGANLANSHCGKHQLALIKGLGGVKILELWTKLRVGAYLSTGVIIKQV